MLTGSGVSRGLGALMGLAVMAVLVVAPGAEAQVAVSSNDNKLVLVNGVTTGQNMVEREIWVFRVDGTELRDTGHRIKVNGGPAAIRIADTSR
ncbi:MAG TPA: hypothetical protein VJB36_07850 [Methylomirabilota bacterium]|nr:hypothetical protein [Methylomirabilota bacterium]